MIFVSHEELNDQLQVRRDKMQAMIDNGQDPFGSQVRTLPIFSGDC